MPSRSPKVDQLLDALNHPLRAQIDALRDAILGSDDGISEHVKWNAPSYVHGGEDRVTFRLHPRERLQIVFHRGVKVKDPSGFSFVDRSGLLSWISADRATVTLEPDRAVESAPALAALVAAWVAATARSEDAPRSAGSR